MALARRTAVRVCRDIGLRAKARAEGSVVRVGKHAHKCNNPVSVATPTSRHVGISLRPAVTRLADRSLAFPRLVALRISRQRCRLRQGLGIVEAPDRAPAGPPPRRESLSTGARLETRRD